MPSKTIQYRELWHTEKELEYLDSIITQVHRHPHKREVNVARTLRGYITGCFKRDNWDGMNWQTILSHACRLYNALPEVREDGEDIFIAMSESELLRRAKRRWSNRLLS